MKDRLYAEREKLYLHVCTMISSKEEAIRLQSLANQPPIVPSVLYSPLIHQAPGINEVVSARYDIPPKQRYSPPPALPHVPSIPDTTRKGVDLGAMWTIKTHHGAMQSLVSLKGNHTVGVGPRGLPDGRLAPYRKPHVVRDLPAISIRHISAQAQPAQHRKENVKSFKAMINKSTKEVTKMEEALTE